MITYQESLVKAGGYWGAQNKWSKTTVDFCVMIPIVYSLVLEETPLKFSWEGPFNLVEQVIISTTMKNTLENIDLRGVIWLQTDLGMVKEKHACFFYSGI